MVWLGWCGCGGVAGVVWPSRKGAVFRNWWGLPRRLANHVVGTTNRKPTAKPAVHLSRFVNENSEAALRAQTAVP